MTELPPIMGSEISLLNYRLKKRQVVIGKEVFLKVIVYTKEGKVRRKITKDSPFRLYSI